MIVLAAVAVAVLTIDRLALRAEARGWIYWRTRRPQASVTSAALSDLIEIYQPTLRTVVEEQARQRHAVDPVESAAPPLGVDLDARTVRLPGRRRPPSG